MPKDKREKNRENKDRAENTYPRPAFDNDQLGENASNYQIPFDDKQND